MHSDSEKNMSAYADQNHAPSLTCVRLDLRYFLIIYCIAEFAAFAPSAAAVMICLSSFVLTSPATKNPGSDVTPSSPALMYPLSSPAPPDF